MTISAKYLREWENSNLTFISAEQKRIILERFSTEPDPYEWSAQDIATQIRNYLNCGHWEKPMVSHTDQAEYPFEDDDIPF